jgi:IS605 OrfB family transposase
MKTSQYPPGVGTVGVDKGYTEVLTDCDGNHHGTRLGLLLTAESDHRKAKGRARARLRSVANNARQRGDHAKADRIHRHNLGTLKRERRRARWEAMVRTETFTAVHRVVDKAAVVVAEDLSKSFTGRKPLGKNTNRRLAAWTKGVTAEALKNVSERRGSALTLVNAAYTSQVVPCCNGFGRRSGDRLHCTRCGVVWHADHAGAINVRQRLGDPDITLHTPYQRVRQILLERADRHGPDCPVQDSSRAWPARRRAKYPICSAMSNEQEAAVSRAASR